MTHDSEVPNRVLDELRSVCAALPEAYEEQAWVGTCGSAPTRSARTS